VSHLEMSHDHEPNAKSINALVQSNAPLTTIDMLLHLVQLLRERHLLEQFQNQNQNKCELKWYEERIAEATEQITLMRSADISDILSQIKVQTSSQLLETAKQLIHEQQLINHSVKCAEYGPQQQKLQDKLPIFLRIALCTY